MKSPSLSGVQRIVASAMGVTLINRGLTTGDQCEWPEARAFGSPGQVKFVIRATRLISEKLSALVIAELRSFLPGNQNPA